MLGAIFGDKAGSIYEYNQTKSVQPINIEKIDLTDSFYSDDTIETIAVMDAIINNRDYGEALRQYILDYEDYLPHYKPYFKTSFSPNAVLWAKGQGCSSSIGNGAMMRISPVGFMFDSEEEVIKQSKLVTMPSHNSIEAIDCATTIALMIFYFRNGLDREKVYKKLELPIEYKPFSRFNSTCGETIGNCLYAIYHSESFEDAIIRVLSMGGDTDTNSCIVGAVAEAMYGMSFEQKELAKNGLPQEFISIIENVY